MNNHFWKDPAQYCLQRKIGIFELWGDEFQQVMTTCVQEAQQRLHQETDMDKATSKHSYVALVSTREPIQRTVSLIHQQCNSGYHLKTEQYQAYCRNCSYTEQTAHFWDDHFIHHTNQGYQQLYSYLVANASFPSLGIPVLVVDSPMIYDMFDLFQQGLVERGRSLVDGTPRVPVTTPQPDNITSWPQPLSLRRPQSIPTTIASASSSASSVKSNTEDLGICNFGATSQVMRLLQPASSYYFKLWSRSKRYPTHAPTSL